MITDVRSIGSAAKKASRILAVTETRKKNETLLALADALVKHKDFLMENNAIDVADGRKAGLSGAIVDRLLLTSERIESLAADTRAVAGLTDPVGEEYESRVLTNGMRLLKRRIPLGVVGVIYEARPNVTIDIATLCLKTGNAVILRGGKEALHSNLAFITLVQKALNATGLPASSVSFIDNPDRSLVNELLRLDEYVDMIVPRGGASLHRLCIDQSTIPVITGGMGICHIFVDKSADLEKAAAIVENAKVQRPSVCNALDTLLVHQDIAAVLLPDMAERLWRHGVELRADEKAWDILTRSSSRAKVKQAGPEDFDREWLALILGIRVVSDLDEAIDHIHQHSTEHSDSILTNDWRAANRFLQEINSAAVYVNASTRFTDGGQFGLGAEVAVSTQKLHARGPMGLKELTTYKWIGIGDGHIRE